jgi:hypothetical protein
MRSTLNPEGLTFEEWVCAAGQAVIDQDRVLSYAEAGRCLRGERRAWRQGEDPTEYREMA